MATEAAVATGLLPSTISGTVDLTVSGFGTPTAAIIFTSNANTTNNPQNDGVLGVGFWSSSASTAVGVGTLDNKPDSWTTREGRTAAVVALPIKTSRAPPTYSSLLECTAASITDGLRLTVSVDATGVDRYATAILIKGTTNVKAAEYTLSTGTSYDITSVGFKPDLVFLATVGNTATTQHVAHNICSFGAAHNNSSDTVSQAMAAIFGVDDQGTSITGSYLSNTYCVGQVYNDAVSWRATASDFDASGFTLTTNTNPGSDNIYYLALELADPDDGYVGVVDSNTAASTKAYTGTGFTPDVVGLAGSVCTAVNTVTAGASLALGATDGTRQRCVDLTDEDNQSTTDTDAYADTSNVLRLRFDGGTTDAIAAYSSFDSDGWTLNYSDGSSSARKILAFAIGDSTGAPTGSTGDLAAQESGADSATISGTITVQGTLSAQESGSDTAAFAGSMDISGDLAAVEVGSDTGAFTGSVLVAGTLSVQESGSDTATILGTEPSEITGDLSAQESGSDTAAITGQVHVAGVLSVQESGSDTGAFTGTAPATCCGTLEVQEVGSDTAVILGTLLASGDLAVQETGADGATIVGSVVVSGSLTTQESGSDTLAFTGIVPLTGNLSAQETGSDTAFFSYEEPDLVGNLAVQEGTADKASILGLFPACTQMSTYDAAQAKLNAALIDVFGESVMFDPTGYQYPVTAIFEVTGPENSGSRSRDVQDIGNTESYRPRPYLMMRSSDVEDLDIKARQTVIVRGKNMTVVSDPVNDGQCMTMVYVRGDF